MGYLVTHHFRRGSFRWTDTYGSEEAGAQAAVTKFLPYRQAYLQLCDDAVKLEYASAKNDNGDGRDTYREKVNRSGFLQAQSDGLTPTKQDVIATALHLVAYTTTGRRRNIYVTGIPDSTVKYKTDNTEDPSGSLIDRCNGLIDALAESGARLRVTTPPSAGGAFAWQLVKSFAPAEGTNNRYTTFTLNNVHALALGDLVQMRLGGNSAVELPYRGRHKVVAIGPAEGDKTTVTLQSQYLGAAVSILPDEMYLRKIAFSYEAFNPDLGGFWAFTTKKRGESGTKKGRAKGTSYRH